MSALIGIAPDVDSAGRRSLEPAYAEAVRRAGGEPLVLETADSAALERVGGLLICGGAFDIPPAWYGQRPLARIDTPREQRSRLERALLARAEALGLALLGVCGGAQLMAVHRRGTLIQDLAAQWPGALDHERGCEKHRRVHPVRIAADSRLGACTGSIEFGVNSTHHQAIDSPGDDVRVVARAPDGVAEAIEDPTRAFWLGVQWHPECLADEPSRLLFTAFVAAARERVAS